ncbi:hypothetical protein NDU88_002048 [Pleurodeles waltl]|uniref:Uncharacterized protein n=1 Tax=Pleurodeles waltl TaxID=8319 RepID=A0AAV7L2H5_PLEWA|nr:hypothetical protein NDU88_002048 [Pleurodeles waltl]
MSGGNDEIGMECELDYDEEKDLEEGKIPHWQEHLPEYTKKLGVLCSGTGSDSFHSMDRVDCEMGSKTRHAKKRPWGRNLGSDLQTSETGAATAWDDPEVTPRSTLPIGSKLYLRDPGNLKGEVPEFKEWRMVEEAVFQEASGDPIQRLVRTQRKRRSLEPSGIPEDGARPERRTLAVPTWDKDRRPREANP